MRLKTMPGNVADSLLAPEYWLVVAMGEPEGHGPAEAAWAVAPGIIPRDVISPHAYQVLGCADLCAASNSTRVVLFSDLTRLFASAGTTWAELGVDWQAALGELRDGPYPAVLLSLNGYAHALACEPSAELHQGELSGEPDWAWHERELLRRAIADQLIDGWPAYIASILELGKLRVAS